MSLDPSVLEKIKESALKNALLNAVKHDGKADVKAVVSKVLGEIPDARRSAREVVNIVQEIVSQVNSMTIDEQISILKSRWPDLLAEKKVEKEKTLPPLPNAVEGKVRTRFAPNPDFAIHLGNARPALLSYWYAVEYKGRFILRFEDTDPRLKSPYPEAYQRIRDDLKWLGIKWDEEYIQSLRMEIFYDIAKKLIEKGGAYVDTCPEEEFRKLRIKGQACPHRNDPPENNLERFDKMLGGYFSEGEAVLRVKTDLNHPDPSVRDWVAMRIIDTSRNPHPITGDRYIVWPTYNFAAGVDDHLMGITHILRAKEHISNTVKQKYLYDHLGWEYPTTIHFGRLSLENVILSKSKMRKLIQSVEEDPYSDLRFGTIASLRRRGIRQETIHKIVLDVGIKQVDARISMVNMYAINRTIVDPIAKRYMAVEKPVLAVLKLGRDQIEAHIPRSMTQKEVDSIVLRDGDVVAVSQGDFEKYRESGFRLLGLGNFVVKGTTNIDGTSLFVFELVSTSADEAKRMNLPIIQWVKIGDYAKAILLVASGESVEVRELLAERRILNEKADNIVQLYRIGFARVEKVEDSQITLVFSHD
ncbi:glutamate--tRNA ligase [Thermogladius sp. 4427co]|uniref:glutamate--tRNA ligase n=1 Tax=Thermogladius sp. 4427co TaxID=3450718 RepID=UPI003F7A3ACD